MSLIVKSLLKNMASFSILVSHFGSSVSLSLSLSKSIFLSFWLIISFFLFDEGTHDFFSPEKILFKLFKTREARKKKRMYIRVIGGKKGRKIYMYMIRPFSNSFPASRPHSLLFLSAVSNLWNFSFCFFSLSLEIPSHRIELGVVSFI